MGGNNNDKVFIIINKCMRGNSGKDFSFKESDNISGQKDKSMTLSIGQRKY